jgi:Ca2+-transporting ATPase
LIGDYSRSRSNSAITASSDDKSTLRPTSIDNKSRSRSPSEATTNVKDDLSPEEALKPDQRDIDEFNVTNNPFGYTPGLTNKLLNPKSLDAYKALGGIRGLAKALRTDLEAGLSVDETTFSDKVTFKEASSTSLFESSSQSPRVTEVSLHESPQNFQDRRRVFTDNTLPAKQNISFWKLLWLAYNDKILILLTMAAVISLALGIYETLGQPTEPGQGPKVDWVEGVAICVAIFIVVIVTAINDWQKERQFVKLNKKV